MKIKEIALVGLTTILSACTYSVGMVHSDNSNASTDTLEDTQSAQPNISPVINPSTK